jgi:hypothetical protein
MASKALKALSPLAAVMDGGIKGLAQNFSPAYNLIRKDDEENDSILRKAMKQGAAGKMAGMKKGGKVKAKTSSASKRGDGCAQRGKTRGKMI